jgi:hypothetical protein
MNRTWVGSLLALVAALVIAACGSPSVTPSPNPGGGNGGGGVQQPPPVVNNPPQIKSIAASTTRVEVGTPITLTAAVEDTDTPLGNLTYTWSAETGTFSGTGPVVTWSPSADAKTPADYVITLTVSETYTSGSLLIENKTVSTMTAHVNNSSKELAELSLRFLGDFANSGISPEKCVSEFSDSCRGKKDELQDIIDNRHDFLILSSSLRHTSLQIATSQTSATVHTACAFTSRVISSTPQSGGCLADPASCKLGAIQSADGDCSTTNVYERGRWWICTSSYTPRNALTAFERAFFGIRRPEI